jgi:DinB superfamily
VRHSKYEQPGVPLTNRHDAIVRLRYLLSTAVPRLAAVSETEASVPRIGGKWSAKQILGHLIDSATNNHHRFVRSQIEGSLTMQGYTQDEWVGVQHYQDERWEALSELWKSYNRHMLHLMEIAPEENLKNECTIGGDVSGTLEFLMVDYVAHLEHHLNQIFATVA